MLAFIRWQLSLILFNLSKIFNDISPSSMSLNKETCTLTLWPVMTLQQMCFSLRKPFRSLLALVFGDAIGVSFSGASLIIYYVIEFKSSYQNNTGIYHGFPLGERLACFVIGSFSWLPFDALYIFWGFHC